MPRQLRRVETSGKDNSCFVHALATNLVVYYYATAPGYGYEHRFIKAVDYSGLEKVYQKINGEKATLFRQACPPRPQVYIEKMGKALRCYGASLIMEDVAKSVENRQYSETLLQTLLAAFENHCGKTKDDFCDEVFAGMQFVTDKFKALHHSSSTSMEQKKQALAAWWNAAYVKQASKQQQPGGYQLYAKELEKDGVQLSPQIGNIITRHLGLNLVFGNEGYDGLNYAANAIDAPCVMVYRNGPHWEALLDPSLVTAFNNNNTVTKKLSATGGTVHDTTYLAFLTSTQRIAFYNCFSEDNSEGDEAIKVGRALAHCYKLKDTEANQFATTYQNEILNGSGMLQAVAKALVSRVDPDNEERVFNQNNGGILDADRFVQGFIDGACCSQVCAHNLIKFARVYAQAAESADHDNTDEQVKKYCFDSALEWEKSQNQIWHNNQKNRLSNMFQHESVTKVEIVNKVQVAADQIRYDVHLKNGLILRYSVDAPGQPLVIARGEALKKLTVAQVFDAIAMVFIKERCAKYNKTKDELTGKQAEITLDFINPPSKAQECEAAFLNAGFKKVVFKPEATDTSSNCRREVPRIETPPRPIGMAF